MTAVYFMYKVAARLPACADSYAGTVRCKSARVPAMTPSDVRTEETPAESGSPFLRCIIIYEKDGSQRELCIPS